MKGYKSFTDFLSSAKIRTGLSKSEYGNLSPKPTTTSTLTSVQKDISVNWYNIILIVISFLGSLLSGTSCYCFFKCFRNDCQCKVNSMFFVTGHIISIIFLECMVAVKIQKL